ncbi:NAD(P)H-dependent oxidoreductase, partial [Streptomyces sp. NPDC006314]|uniref:NAD(P)H-dependent oxidoreductase n=1 Tax=Streptomyces sp. NPDC006314 TaxID=3154475 RepID=UPI0033A0AFFF
MEPVNVAIIYYSSTGTIHALAQAAAEGAEKAGASVRLRKVAETAPPEAINANPAWAEHVQGESAGVAEVAHDDLAWADAVLFGTPTRFGNPASQLRAFIDTTGPLWFQGKLADKV